MAIILTIRTMGIPTRRFHFRLDWEALAIGVAIVEAVATSTPGVEGFTEEAAVAVVAGLIVRMREPQTSLLKSISRNHTGTTRGG